MRKYGPQQVGPEFSGFVGHCPTKKIAEPMPLVNSHYLYLYNQLGLKRKERYLATLEYRYWYQATADENSWIFSLRVPP